MAVSSILRLVGQARSTSYSASKAAIVNLVRSTGLTYAPVGIRVNAVAPGYVDTPLVAGLDESVRGKMIERMPNGRLGTPEEVAEVVCFLASDAASARGAEATPVSAAVAFTTRVTSSNAVT